MKVTEVFFSFAKGKMDTNTSKKLLSYAKILKI